MGTNRAGVPSNIGGYDYSTSKAQNRLFNQGELPEDGVQGSTGGYDYSAKGQANRMYRMRNLTPIPPTSPVYSAKKNADDLFDRQSKARGK